MGSSSIFKYPRSNKHFSCQISPGHKYLTNCNSICICICCRHTASLSTHIHILSFTTIIQFHNLMLDFWLKPFLNGQKAFCVKCLTLCRLSTRLSHCLNLDENLFAKLVSANAHFQFDLWPLKKKESNWMSSTRKEKSVAYLCGPGRPSFNFCHTACYLCRCLARAQT